MSDSTNLSDNERTPDASAMRARDARSTASLLLDLPVPFRRIGDVLHVEAQAHNGILRWLDNFDRLTICAPVVPDDLADPTLSWLPVDDLLRGGTVSLHELPWAYHPRDHLRHRAQAKALYRRLIPEHRYLCFANLGWAGAWGNIAADEAARIGRPYAVWMDSVLHEMRPAVTGNVARRAAAALRTWMEKRYAMSSIGGAAVGLFHGRTVYDGYAPISRNPHVVHNIHLKRSDVVGRDELAARLAAQRAPVRIGYVGRVLDIKGPLQWIAAMGRLAQRLPGRFQATWLGDGAMLEDCRREVARLGLGDVVFFPGGERDRRKVLEFLRSLDLFAFCHLTLESPRCLIESLMSGVPIVGYESTYAHGLVTPTGGGDFVAIGDVDGLADRLAHYLEDVPARHAASFQALDSGEHFSDEAVFAHRSELIKRYLAPDAPAAGSAERGPGVDSVGA